MRKIDIDFKRIENVDFETTRDQSRCSIAIVDIGLRVITHTPFVTKEMQSEEKIKQLDLAQKIWSVQ